MARKVAGVCYIKADDIQFEVKGGVECPMSSTIREPVESLANDAGSYSEKGMTPYVKLTAIFEPDFDIIKVSTATDLTITAELANGKVYTLTEAYLSGETPVKGDEGEVDLNFNGRKGVWK